MNCPLCTVEEPLRRVPGWSIIPAPGRLPGTRHHLFLVPEAHVADLLDLPTAAQVRMWRALDWARDTYQLTYYGLYAETGGHAHLQVIVGDATQSVYVKIGSKEHAHV